MKMSRIAALAWFLLRVGSGLLFLQAGGMKLFGWFGGMPEGVTAPIWSQTWIGWRISV